MEKMRPIPTELLIEEMTGRNDLLSESLHHGLAESPALKGFYPSLDLSELVAFAPASWKLREMGNAVLRETVDSGDVYRIFRNVLRLGAPWVDQHKKICFSSDSFYKRMNPFGGFDLKERLSGVSKNLKKELIHSLRKPTKNWVFCNQYGDLKSGNNGKCDGIEVMRFQNFDPEKSKARIVPNYVREISRILSAYPRDYSPLSKDQDTRPELAEDGRGIGKMFSPIFSYQEQ